MKRRLVRIEDLVGWKDWEGWDSCEEGEGVGTCDFELQGMNWVGKFWYESEVSTYLLMRGWISVLVHLTCRASIQINYFIC